MDLRIGKIQILPLQAQALANTQPGRCRQQRQGTLQRREALHVDSLSFHLVQIFRCWKLDETRDKIKKSATVLFSLMLDPELRQNGVG